MLRRVVVVLIVLLAVLALALRFALSRVGDYEDEIVAWLSDVAGTEVQVGTMTATLRGVEPIAELSEIHIAPPDGAGRGLRVGRMRIGFDLFASLLSGQAEISALHIFDTDFLVVTDADGNSRVSGFLPMSFSAQDDPVRAPPDFDLHVERANIRWRNEQAGVDYEFENASAAFKSENGRLQLAARASLPASLGQLLHIAADLGDGDPADGVSGPAERWTGRIYVRADNADLAQWARLAGKAGAAQGILSAEVWSDWRGGVLQRLDSTLACETCTVADGFEPGPVSLATRLSWEAREDGWQLGLLDFDWASPGVTIEHSDAALVYREDDSRLVLRAPAFDEELLHTIVAERFREKGVEIFGGHGALAVSAAIAHPDFEPPVRPPVAAEVQAPVNASDWWRLMENNLQFATGYVSEYADYLRSSAAVKTARVDASLEKTAVRLPGWSEQTFDLDEISASVRYVDDAPAYTIDVDNLFVRFGGAQLGGRFAWTNGATPTADVALTVEDLPLTSVRELLPRTGLRPRLAAWLEQAFVTGVLKSARVELNGALSSFPFKDGGGWFYAEGEIADTTLNYRANRRPLRDLNARVVLDDQRMVVEASSLRYYDFESRAARAVIEDVMLPFVEVDATGAGPFASVLAYLKDERLVKPDSIVIRSLEPGGGSRLDLSVQAPLSKKVDKPLTVSGALDFDGASLRVVPLDLEFSDIAGKLNFDRGGGTARLLTAKLNGLPITAAAKPVEGATSLALEGDLPVSQLFDLSATPLRDAVQGTAPWRADFLIPGLRADAEYELKTTLSSSLEGVAVALPAPFGKDAAQRRDFSADIVLGRQGKYVLSYGDEIKVALVRDPRAAAPWGYLHFGDAAPPPIVRGVFRVGGEINEAVEIDDWLGLAGENSDVGSYLNHVEVSFAELRQGGEALGEASVAVKPRDGGHELQIAAPWAQGWVFMPAADDGVVFAKMEKLFLPKSAAADTDTGMVLNPAAVPAFEMEVADFRRGDATVSNLHLVTEPMDGGMRIGRLAFEAGEVLATLSGQWVLDGQRHRTHLDLDVNGRDFGRMLRLLGVSSSLEDGDGSLTGRVAWDDRPAGFALEKIEGDVNVRLEDGVLEKADPGISRLLGLFSVGHIVRRLSLDFRDIIKKGLSFDTLEGEINFDNGVMRMEDFIITGPALAMAVSGDNYIAEKRYDQRIDVVPNLSSGLPVVGALLAGPIAGAAVYLLDRLTKFGSRMDKVITLHYRLHGDWDDPQVDFEGTPEAEKGTKGAGKLLDKVLEK